MIANEEGVWHVGKLLAILVSQFERRRHAVRDGVVHESRSACTRVPEPHGLRIVRKRIVSDINSQAEQTKSFVGHT